MLPRRPFKTIKNGILISFFFIRRHSCSLMQRRRSKSPDLFSVYFKCLSQGEEMESIITSTQLIRIQVLAMICCNRMITVCNNEQTLLRDDQKLLRLLFSLRKGNDR